MSDVNALFYRPSGKFPPYAIPATLGAGLATGVLGGAVYGVLDWWVPFIYILVFATIGLGLGQAYAVSQLLRVFKMRNAVVGTACGLGCGLFAYYGAWIGWIFAGSDWDLLVFSPVAIFDIARLISETGTWGLSSGDPVSGIFLLGFWLVEAGIIIVPSVLAGRGCCKTPFNEKVGAWADQNESLPPLAPISSQTKAALSQGLAQGDFSGLQQLQPLEHESSTFTNISFAWAPADRDTQFMSIDSISLSQDKDGKVKVHATPIAEHMILDAESRALIEEIFAESRQALPTQSGPVHNAHAENAEDAEALGEMLED